MITELNEIEQKIQELFPTELYLWDNGKNHSRIKAVILNRYENKINDNAYRNKRSYTAFLNYSSLTELQKIGYINEKIYIDEKVMILVQDPGTGTKFSVLINLVFNDYVKYRDRDFFKKYAILFEL